MVFQMQKNCFNITILLDSVPDIRACNIVYYAYLIELFLFTAGFDVYVIT